MKLISTITNDVVMFLIGFALGTIIDHIIDHIHTYVDDTKEKKYTIAVIGMFQVIGNGLILRYIDECNIDRGLFGLGLFGAQFLVFRGLVKSTS
jgi:hypothetical protein